MIMQASGVLQKNPRFEKSLTLYERAEELFPFGTQLLSRSPHLSAFGQAPIYFERAKDGHFWDVDGNEFIDLGMGCGPAILGYCYQPVDAAVKAQIDKGVIGSVNHELEITFAEKVCSMVPCAEMVKICKGGGEANAIAVRLARGYTGKDIVLFCGYHGWYDWYIAANLDAETRLDEHLRPGIVPKGVPTTLTGTAVPFAYDDIPSLRSALQAHSGKVACIVLEPTRSTAPQPGYFQQVRDLAHAHDCLLIFDEVVTGFRMAPGGAQEHYGVTPDLAAFGKAIANGYPLAVVAGRKQIMASQYDNFISSTFYSETASLAAGLATLNEIASKPVLQTINAIGESTMNGLKELAQKHAIRVNVSGYGFHFDVRFNYGPDTGRVATLFMQEMAVRGVYLLGRCYMCYTHTDRDVQQVLAAADEVFGILAKAVLGNSIDDFLKAPEHKVVFKRRLV